MQDGHYLAVYISAKNIYKNQIPMTRHDQNMSLWLKNGKDIKLIEFYEIERYTRKKQHSNVFLDFDHVREFIDKLLKPRNLTINHMREVWGLNGLTEKDDNAKPLAQHTYHCVCHLFSSMLIDSDIFYNEDILSIGVDGGPDNEFDYRTYLKPSFSGCFTRKGEAAYFHVSSPGKLWNAMQFNTGLREGTLMALATATKCILNNEPHKPIHIYHGFPVNEVSKKVDDVMTDYFNYFKDQKERFMNNQEHRFEKYDGDFSAEENIYSATMKQVQQMSIEIMCENIDKAILEYQITPNETYLALSGGYALNCPTNSFLMKKYGFKGFLCSPAPNDAGQSLGIGLYNFYIKMKEFNFKLGHAYYGFAQTNMVRELNDPRFKGFIKSVSGYSPKQAVNDICESPIVWFNGRAEIGPRALGNRSILGDPRKSETADILNSVKQRQWWRPVAPVILHEDMSQWFEDINESPYMLQTFYIMDHAIDKIPAVSHLDRSARVQTVRKSQNAELHGLISAFKQRTGIPILCNTSLNDKGEPIINTIAEAINFALGKGFKIIYINKTRVELCSHDDYKYEMSVKNKDYLLCDYFMVEG